jgi:hypothetical protein
MENLPCQRRLLSSRASVLPKSVHPSRSSDRPSQSSGRRFLDPKQNIIVSHPKLVLQALRPKKVYLLPILMVIIQNSFLKALGPQNGFVCVSDFRFEYFEAFYTR